jgi:hypothetical protein
MRAIEARAIRMHKSRAHGKGSAGTPFCGMGNAIPFG